MTKTKLNTAIAANDTGRIITSGGVMAQWLLEDNPSATSTSLIRSPILTPTDTHPNRYSPQPPRNSSTPIHPLRSSLPHPLSHFARTYTPCLPSGLALGVDIKHAPSALRPVPAHSSPAHFSNICRQASTLRYICPCPYQYPMRYHSIARVP